MAGKPLDLTAAVGDQTSVTLGHGNRDKNRIVIALTNTSEEPVAFGGFGQSGRFNVTFSIGSGPEDLVRTMDESVDLAVDAPDDWQALPYKKVANQAVYAFRLPRMVFGPGESKTVTVKSFTCCTDPGQARLQIAFSISDYKDFESSLEVKKKAAVFELLFFEADPPYIATDEEKQAFTLSWSTVQAGQVVLEKNKRTLKTFTDGKDGFENGRKYTYKEERPDLPDTEYELTAFDQADASRSQTVKLTVHVLQPGWHAVNFPKYGYPAVLCSLNDVKMYGVFIKRGRACLCTSRHPSAIWDLENDRVPDDMATSPGAGFNNRFWLVGGSSVDPDNCSNHICCYDIEQGRWQENQAPWTARMGHACVTFNKRLWVMGGLDADGNPLQDVHSMDANGNWRPHDDAPWDPRCMPAAAACRGRLWIYGGCEEPFGNPRTDMWRSLDGDTWEPYRYLPRPDNGDLGQPISNALQDIGGRLHLLGSFRDENTVRALMFELDEAQQSWFDIPVNLPWGQHMQNTHSLSGATFNGLLFLRPLDYRIEDNPARLYLYKP